MPKTSDPRIRGAWLVGLVAVVFGPVLLYALVGTREVTSILERLLVITGIQAFGLLAYTMVLATRFRSKSSEFGVPLHRWVATGAFFTVLAHVVLALMANSQNIFLLSFVWAPSRGVAATFSLIFLGFALAMGEFRRRLKLPPERWRLMHIILAWLTGIFAFAHILWVDKLVNSPLWLVIFVVIVFLSTCMWLTRAKQGR